MKQIIIDEYVNLERPIGYVPSTHFTVEDEIMAIFDKEKRIVEKIIRFDGYRVYCSKKLRKDTYKKVKEFLK